MPKLSSDLFKKLATDQGFQLAGIAKPHISNEKKESYMKWIHNGGAASMDWIKNRIEERLEPQTYFKNLKSVLVIAKYYNPQKAGTDINLSSYIRGEDYHQTIKKSLWKIATQLKEEYGEDSEFRVCVDTSPVLEREFAMLGGLGWIGKNSLLINQKKGSFCFLGEIFTNLETDSYDKPVDDRCGTCTKCIDACPPTAIIKPGYIDSAKCISYQTIEHKGSFDNNPTIDNWVYGCDICQDVCPWNLNLLQKNTPLPDTHLYKKEHPIDELSLAKILSLSPTEFSKVFRKTAAKRIKRKGLIRNALEIWKVNPEMAPKELVENLLNDEDSEINQLAKSALIES